MKASNIYDSFFNRLVLIKSFILLALFSSSLTAQTKYFISSSQGNDSNNGISNSSPWASIAKVNKEMNTFNAGDVIAFKSGDIFDDATLKITAGGKNGNNIIFTSYGTGSKAIIGSFSKPFSLIVDISADYIQFENIEIRAGNNSNISSGVVIYGNYITLRGNHIRGESTTTSHNGTGIVVSNDLGAHRFVTIDNNEVEHFRRGIINQGGLFVTISNNIVHDIWYMHAGGGDGGEGGRGIRIISSMTNIVDFKYTSSIIGNTIFNFDRFGIDCATASNVIIEYNHIYSSLPAGYSGVYGSDKYGSGMKVSEEYISGQKSVGNIVRYNEIHDLHDEGTGGYEAANDGIITAFGRDGWIYGNLIYDIDGIGVNRNRLLGNSFTTNLSWKIYNNTIIAGKEGILIDYYANSPTYIANNIITAGDGHAGIRAKEAIYEGSNIYTNRQGYVQNNNNVASAAIVQSENSQFFYTRIGDESLYNTDPLFVDGANEDYRLANSESPAIDVGYDWGIDGNGDTFIQDISGNIGIGAIEYSNTSYSNQTSGVLRVFLEGNYEKNIMSHKIHTQNYLPPSSPYAEAPWNISDSRNFTFKSSDIVDWLILELRPDINTIAHQKACLLMNDGIILNHSGEMVTFSGITSKDYYIVIHHRNHLSIMSSSKVFIHNDEPIAYDFTNSQNKAYGKKSMADLGNGLFGMFAGDADGNNIINNLDFGVVANKIPSKGYHNSDLDLNGVINVLDYNKINYNILKSSNVP